MLTTSMLKRHRQSSPPPTSSNFHLLPNLGAEEPQTKRRRTQQPTQDGPASQAVGDDDSYEGYREDLPTHTPTHESTEMTNTSVEYKSANTMLRDLHILNQHRLMFSPPAPHPISTTQISSLNPTQHLDYSTPPTKLNPVQTGKMSKPYSSRLKIAEQDQLQAGRLEEADVVSDNYENINKLLGSVFLSRRRILDSSSHSVSFS